MNVYDSKRMADVLKPHGYSLSETPDEANLVVLNTCHIREKAAEKVYSEIGRLRQIKEAKAASGEDMYIAVAGCVAQAEGPEMMRRAPAIDLVLGPQTYHRLPDMLKSAEEQRQSGRRSSRVLDTEFPVETKFDHLPQDSDFEGPAAFLTVQEGCDKFCTFCVVPYTRGAEYSRPVQDILDEAKLLINKGVLEITLLGQNVNAYHGDLENGKAASLGELIRRLADLDGLERIRYTTSHPRDMDGELIAAHRDIPQCMPYLHLPVQSGSDKILEAMNRKHTAERYFEIIDELRVGRPDIALSSDFIVGFPGESDEDFEATMELVRKVDYAQAYSFKYSPRPGTPASVMDTQVEEHIKSERLTALQALLGEQQINFNKKSVGKTMDVLLEREGKEAGQLVGRSPYLQAVHVDVTNTMQSNNSSDTVSHMMNKLAKVEIVEAGPRSLKGKLAGH